VYDYGIGPDGPYYTMELLSGVDLGELAPLPWREVCRLLLDVASSLAVVHSRRLLHRDVTARNVRRTADGRAKLLDFGAMTEMGVPRNTVGTPPYTPSEAVLQQPLDGRADLYALGALAYFALLGQHAYPARTMAALREHWRTQPRAPATLSAEIPETLSQLVMSLLQHDPLARPQSAAEVMMRLASIANLPLREDANVQHAYLTTPKLVAREAPLLRIRKQMIRAIRGRGGAMLVVGPSGAGRSRFVDACVLEGQLAGLLALRADIADAGQPFGAARRMVQALVNARPALAAEVETAGLSGWLAAAHDTADADNGLKRDALLERLGALLLRASDRHAIVIALDDAPSIDEPSLALLASIVRDARSRRLVMVLSAEHSALSEPGLALRMLGENARKIALEPLGSADVRSLLGSVFGEIPNLDLLATLLGETSVLLPRNIMDAAQGLVHEGIARYEGGRWYLASEGARIRTCLQRARDVS
ncbi:MAG: serine/threonine-protein kinase, partial [Myxococcales bacterium]|nr:serine/threonine-protein kinase [Myxococcales bacterium]